MSIPEILYQLRTKHKYSQENVALELGVDYTTYARYEAGKTEIKASQAQKLAELYGLSIDEFYHYGSKNTKVSEPEAVYNKTPKNKLSLTVELDGTEETINKWLRLLPELNKVMQLKAG